MKDTRHERMLTFSRVFPSYHLRKGEPTYFVEAILSQLRIDYTKHDYFIWLVENNSGIGEIFLHSFFQSLSQDIDPKSHTIRNHVRPLKVGDWINPKYWAGRPYNKTKEGYWQIKFAPDIEVKKVYDIEIINQRVIINGVYFGQYARGFYDANVTTLANNDGLSLADFESWFGNKFFQGQIISWSDTLNY
jgi:hypothetical protein